MNAEPGPASSAMVQGVMASASPASRSLSSRSLSPRSLSPRSPLNAAGEERPRFLLNFPKDEQLEALMALFEEGNFYELRKQVRALDPKTVSPEVHRAAEELFHRTEPDPAIKWLLLMCFALFAFIVSWVYLP